MTNNFTFSLPTKIVFGRGERKNLNKIARENGWMRGVLLCDRFLLDSGTAKELCAANDSVVATYPCSSPSLSEVNSAKAFIVSSRADFVVALGGGSSIDLAKFACSLALNDGEAEDYFYRRKAFTDRKISLIALPTTAGTGSEVTSVSVCFDEKTNEKVPLVCQNFYPDYAVVDSELTLSVPPFVTATTGLDALSHALESFWAKTNQPICDCLATNAAKLVFENLEKCYFYPKDVSARDNMALASLLSGIAFSKTRTAAVHACSYPLSEDYKMCHGEACAFTLDSFIRVNESERLGGLARAAGFSSCADMARKVMEMKEKFCLKTTLDDAGITDTKSLSEKCLAHSLFQNNPVELTTQEMKKLFDNLR